MEEFRGKRYYDLLFLCLLFRGMNKIDDAQTVQDHTVLWNLMRKFR